MSEAISTAPTLYSTPIGNAPMFVLWFAAIANIDLEVKNLSIPKMEHKTPEYLAIAPSGQLPALVDGEIKVYESDAIVRYLAAKHQSPAYPLNDPEALARIDSAYSWLWFNAWTAERDVAIQTWLIEVIRGGTADPEALANAIARLDATLDFCEANFFADDPHCVTGTTWTVADALLGTMLWHLEVAARTPRDLSQRPRLAAYWKHMQADAGFQKLFGASNAAIAGILKAKGIAA